MRLTKEGTLGRMLAVILMVRKYRQVDRRRHIMEDLLALRMHRRRDLLQLVRIHRRTWHHQVPHRMPLRQAILLPRRMRRPRVRRLHNMQDIRRRTSIQALLHLRSQVVRPLRRLHSPEERRPSQENLRSLVRLPMDMGRQLRRSLLDLDSLMRDPVGLERHRLEERLGSLVLEGIHSIRLLLGVHRISHRRRMAEGVDGERQTDINQVSLKTFISTYSVVHVLYGMYCIQVYLDC